MKKSMRLVVIALGILGLVATAAPQPAQARTVGTAVFAAQVTVGAPGLGYPVLTLTPTVGVPAQSCLSLPGGFGDDPACVTNSHWLFGNTRSLSANSIACVGVALNVNKAKGPVSGPSCGFASAAGSLPNTVSGHCGLSSGQLFVHFTDGSNVYVMDLHFKAVASVVLLSGHWTNNLGQRGLIVAVAQAAPPTPVANLSESCVNKTARNFLVVGVGELVTQP